MTPNHDQAITNSVHKLFYTRGLMSIGVSELTEELRALADKILSESQLRVAEAERDEVERLTKERDEANQRAMRKDSAFCGLITERDAAMSERDTLAATVVELQRDRERLIEEPQSILGYIGTSQFITAERVSEGSVALDNWLEGLRGYASRLHAAMQSKGEA